MSFSHVCKYIFIFINTFITTRITAIQDPFYINTHLVIQNIFLVSMSSRFKVHQIQISEVKLLKPAVDNSWFA